jgi:hypothetical protein
MSIGPCLFLGRICYFLQNIVCDCHFNATDIFLGCLLLFNPLKAIVRVGSDFVPLN